MWCRLPFVLLGLLASQAAGDLPTTVDGEWQVSFTLFATRVPAAKVGDPAEDIVVDLMDEIVTPGMITADQVQATKLLSDPDGAGLVELTLNFAISFGDDEARATAVSGVLGGKSFADLSGILRGLFSASGVTVERKRGPTKAYVCNEPYYFEKGGRCIPVVGTVVGNLGEPDVNITRESDEDITFTLVLAKIAEENFEGHELYYVIDIKPSEGQLSPQSTWKEGGPLPEGPGCRLLWQPKLDSAVDHPEDPAYMVASLTRSYAELSVDCRLDVEAKADTIERDGVVAIYVVSNSTDESDERVHGEYVERNWVSFVTTIFDPKTTAFLYPFWIGDIDLSDRFNRTFHLGGFESTLTLWETDGFAVDRTDDKRYEVGDPVYVRHMLLYVSSKLDLHVEEVFLSTSPEPKDQAAIVHVLSDQLTLHDEDAKSMEKFMFIARRCENCYLHVISLVEHDDSRRLLGSRRLAEGGDSYSMQTVYAEMLPPASHEWRKAGGPMLNINLLIRGMDYSGLMGSTTLRLRFTAELTDQVVKSLGNNIRHEHCLVTLSPGSVYADLLIKIPADADLSAIRATIEAPSFEAMLEDDVTRSLAAIEGVDSVTHGTISTEVTAIVFDAPEEAAQDAPSSLGALELGLIVAAAACLVGLLACTCMLCCRGRQPVSKAAREQPAEPAAKENQQTERQRHEACV